jgi:hypothetical protein
MIRRKWLRYYDIVPERTYRAKVIQSRDTCPFRKLYPHVFVVRSGQNGIVDNGARLIDSAGTTLHCNIKGGASSPARHFTSLLGTHAPIRAY